ncbi:MAG: DUF6265 family protein [Ignavibacteria bacterium]|jgi:hypothetical protein
MTITKLLTSSLIIFSTISGQGKILNLIAGKWKLKTNSFEAYEEWKIKDNSEIVGISYSIEDGEQEKTEDIYIKRVGEFWVYIAVPQNQNPVLFHLTSFKDNRFVFENSEHDFPETIIYNFVDKTTIAVKIEGEINGESEKIEFTFVKVK